MIDYTKTLPAHIEKLIGENDLFLEVFEGKDNHVAANERPPLLFVHGAYTGSWMWSKYIPHFVNSGWKCYVMNMRSHYKSRVMDMTKITFDDYLEDIREVVAECGEPPIVIGFSMGGILCHKLAETVDYAGLVLIDSCISREVFEIVPYRELGEHNEELVFPAPEREEKTSIDESEEDIAFQKKYLSMESSNAINTISFTHGRDKGVSVDSSLIKCPSLVIKAVNDVDEDLRGKVTAKQLNGEFEGFWGTTHTGLLAGQRYFEVVERIMKWLERF